MPNGERPNSQLQRVRGHVTQSPVVEIMLRICAAPLNRRGVTRLRGSAMRTAAMILGIGVMTAGCARGPALNASKPPDPSGASYREKLIGRWYGEQATEEGGKRSEVTDLCRDGTARFQFHIVEKSGSV